MMTSFKETYTTDQKIRYLYSGLRIRIHFIRIRIQHFRQNTDPDPNPIRIRIWIESGSRALMTKNVKKITAEKKKFWIKNYNLPIPRPP